MKKQKTVINKKTKFSEILKKHPETAEIFMEEGMYCVGCPMSSTETIEQGSLAHGISPDKIIERLNKKLKKK